MSCKENKEQDKIRVHCGELFIGYTPSCNDKKNITKNCRNCGANDFKNNKCNYCKTTS